MTKTFAWFAIASFVFTTGAHAQTYTDVRTQNRGLAALVRELSGPVDFRVSLAFANAYAPLQQNSAPTASTKNATIGAWVGLAAGLGAAAAYVYFTGCGGGSDSAAAFAVGCVVVPIGIVAGGWAAGRAIGRENDPPQPQGATATASK